MGCFSWMYADNPHKNLVIGRRGYVVFPSDQGACGLPPGTILKESDYEGYGCFSGYDVYDLVAEWNKDFVSEKNIRVPERSFWGDTEKDDKYYEAAVKRYHYSINRLKDFQAGKPDDYMKDTYGSDWKREIGIDIACYDHENAALKYPIKIVQFKRNVKSYDALPPSNSDPNQGFY